MLNVHCGRFAPVFAGYIAGMSDEELGELMADVEVALVETVDRLGEAQRRRLYVAVLELEGRMHVLQDAMALVAEHLAAGHGGARPLTG